MAPSCLLLQLFLSSSKGYGILVNGLVVPILLGLNFVCKVLVLLAKTAFKRSASKRPKKQLNILLGFMGFLSVISIVLAIALSVFYFDFDSVF